MGFSPYQVLARLFLKAALRAGFSKSCFWRGFF